MHALSQLVGLLRCSIHLVFLEYELALGLQELVIVGLQALSSFVMVEVAVGVVGGVIGEASESPIDETIDPQLLLDLADLQPSLLLRAVELEQVLAQDG